MPREDSPAPSPVESKILELSDKVELAFDQDGAEKSKEILGLITAKIESVNKSIRSRFFTIVILVTLFELLSRSSISEVSISGLKVNDLTFVQKLIPLCVSYLYCNWLVLYMERRSADITFDAIFSKLYPSFYNIDVEDFSKPSENLRFFLLISRTYKGRTKIIEHSTLIIMGALLLIFPSLVIRQIIYLYSNFEWRDAILIVSTILSPLLLIQALVAVKGGTNLIEGKIYNE